MATISETARTTGRKSRSDSTRRKCHATATRILGFAPLAGLDGLLAAMACRARTVAARSSGPGYRSKAAPGRRTVPDRARTCPFMERGREALAASLLDRAAPAGGRCRGRPVPADGPGCRLLPGCRRAAGCSQRNGMLSARALHRHGAHQQWDIVLSWAPQDVVASAPRRDRARRGTRAGRLWPKRWLPPCAPNAGGGKRRLLAALGPAVLDLAAGGAAGTEHRGRRDRSGGVRLTRRRSKPRWTRWRRSTSTVPRSICVARCRH